MYGSFKLTLQDSCMRISEYDFSDRFQPYFPNNRPGFLFSGRIEMFNPLTGSMC